MVFFYTRGLSDKDLGIRFEVFLVILFYKRSDLVFFSDSPSRILLYNSVAWIKPFLWRVDLHVLSPT